MKVIINYSHFLPCNDLHSVTIITEMAQLQYYAIT